MHHVFGIDKDMVLWISRKVFHCPDLIGKRFLGILERNEY